MSVIINGTTGIDTIQDGTVTRTKTSGLTDLLQTVTFQTGAVATGTTVIPLDDTIPQITEGNEYMTLSITPVSATSILEIEVRGFCSSSGSGTLIGGLFQDATVNALTAGIGRVDGLGTPFMACVTLTFRITAGSTSATTFRFRAGSTTAGTTTFNGFSGGRQFGGVMNSYITIKEWLA